MNTTTTVLHVQAHTPDMVERALSSVFVREERAQVLRLEGTYANVLARALDPELSASYRYLICRPHPQSNWTPVLELGNRTVGLDVELSRMLDGCAVFTTFVYGGSISGYRLARDGSEVDRYVSDPTYFDEEIEASEGDSTAPTGTPAPASDVETARGHPERFSDLLPAGTAPDDFARIVLRPGWWETHDAGTPAAVPVAGGMDEEDGEDEEVVDENDRMRCIALALELWGPEAYPFAEDLEEIPSKIVGPVIALAFA